MLTPDTGTHVGLCSCYSNTLMLIFNFICSDGVITIKVTFWTTVTHIYSRSVWYRSLLLLFFSVSVWQSGHILVWSGPCDVLEPSNLELGFCSNFHRLRLNSRAMMINSSSAMDKIDFANRERDVVGKKRLFKWIWASMPPLEPTTTNECRQSEPLSPLTHQPPAYWCIM